MGYYLSCFQSVMGDIPLCLIHIKLMLMFVTNAACNVLIGANVPPTRLGGVVKKNPLKAWRH